MPDADSVTFWRQVAGIYSSYSNVCSSYLMSLILLPGSCWLSACTITDKAYSDDCQCVKTLTFARRGHAGDCQYRTQYGATNLVLVAGMDWGFNLSLIGTYHITGLKYVYDTHPYPYVENCRPTGMRHSAISARPIL